ncbi:MAG: hypothetical protein KF779_18630 [Hyphomonadaceae bacterium]|nr:hypothetical protein [Hyphomonadaceae bacterium]
MKRVLVASSVVGWLLAPGVASAEPGRAAEVYGPSVHAGESELELRTGVLNGGDADGEWQTKIEASHAFTDFWRPGLVAEWEHEGGETEFTAVAIENVFDFTGTRDWPVHFGAYLEYEVNTQDGPDGLELKLLMQRARGPLDLTLNLIGEREVGSGSSDTWEFGYAAEAAYALNEDFALGIQGFGDAGTDDDFGDLGDHAHYWGPFAQFELAHIGAGEVELQLGYLVGAGDSEADGQFRFKLEYEFGDDD